MPTITLEQGDVVIVDDTFEHFTRTIGAHLSVAGGLTKGVDRAVAIGANGLQIFAGSPRSWQPKPINETELQEFQNYAQKYNIRDIFIHALYLVNLASENTEIVQKSKNSLINNLKIGKYFECSGVVVHLGSHLGRGWEAVRENVALLISQIIDESGTDVPFLIENSAGQQGKLSSDLAEIRWLIDKVNRPTLGWCYDTCHGWAAGYSPTQGRDLFTDIEKYNLWPYLHCLHVNDSRDGLGSGRDRHDNIGEGNLPQKDLSLILNHPHATKIPIITEAPGFDSNGPDKENITRISRLLIE